MLMFCVPKNAGKGWAQGLIWEEGPMACPHHTWAWPEPGIAELEEQHYYYYFFFLCNSVPVDETEWSDPSYQFSFVAKENCGVFCSLHKSFKSEKGGFFFFHSNKAGFIQREAVGGGQAKCLLSLPLNICVCMHWNMKCQITEIKK